MKMTFFITLRPYSGMDNREVSLANYFSKLGHDVSILTFENRRADIDSRIKVEEYTPLNLEPSVFFYISEKLDSIRYLFSPLVRRQLKKLAPDIVFVDYPPMDWYAVKNKRVLNYKLVFTFHGFDPSNPRVLSIYRKSIQNLAKMSNLVVSVSNFAKLQLQELGINSTIIPNGVNTDLFRPHKIVPGFMKIDPILLFVGKIWSPRKVHLLIKAFKIVKKEIPKVKLYLVGPADWDKGAGYLHSLFNQIWIEKDIVYLGPQNELLPSLYSIADIFTSAAPFETFGMPFLEAQACGTPCVGINGGAIPEIVKNGETGILVDKGNIKEMALVIIELLKNNNLREAMGKNARKHARNYDWKKIVDYTLKKLEKI